MKKSRTPLCPKQRWREFFGATGSDQLSTPQAGVAFLAAATCADGVGSRPGYCASSTSLFSRSLSQCSRQRVSDPFVADVAMGSLVPKPRAV